MLASAERHAVSAEKRPSTETTPQVLSVEMEKGLLRNASSAWGPSTAHQYAHLGVRCLTRVPSTNGKDGPARNNDLLYFQVCHIPATTSSATVDVDTAQLYW